MKRVIVIILVILLIAGGGAGGLMMMGLIPNPFNPTPQGAGTAGMSEAEKAAAELTAQKKFQPPAAQLDLIKLEDMIIPVIIEGQVTRRVFITARLRVDAPANVSVVEARLRPYQDAVLREFIPYFQKYYLDRDEADILEIKAKLTQNAKKIFGDMVPEVLLINVFEQASPRSR